MFTTNAIIALIAVGFLLFVGYVIYSFKTSNKKNGAAPSGASSKSDIAELDKVKEIQKLGQQVKKPQAITTKTEIFDEMYKKRYLTTSREETTADTVKSQIQEEPKKVPDREELSKETNQVVNSNTGEPQPTELFPSDEKPQFENEHFEEENTNPEEEFYTTSATDEEEKLPDANSFFTTQSQVQEHDSKVQTNFNEMDYQKSDEFKNREVPKTVNFLKKNNKLSIKYTDADEEYLKSMIAITRRIFNS